MAIKNLVGTSSSTWESANFVASGLPVDGDGVLVPRTCTVNLTQSLDRSADVGGVGNGLNLALLQLLPYELINVGASGSPLKCTADEIIHNGLGELWFESRRTGSTDVTDKIIVNSGNTRLALDLRGNVTVTRLEIIGGAVRHVDVVVTAAFIGQKIGSARTSLLSYGVGPTSIYMNGGTVRTMGTATIVMNGGELTVGGPAQFGSTTGNAPNVSTLYMFGGYCRWMSTPAPTSPTGDPIIYLIGGTLEVPPGIDGNPTISPVIGTIYVWPGATLILPQTNATIITGSRIDIGD